MSQDRPSATDLLRAVREFISDLRPKLEGEAQYNALVATYLLGIVERELTLSTSLDTQEQEQLAEFLRVSGSLADLQQTLCERIRAGHYDNEWRSASELVLSQVINKLRIVRPDYLDPMHAEPTTAAKQQ